MSIERKYRNHIIGMWGLAFLKRLFSCNETLLAFKFLIFVCSQRIGTALRPGGLSYGIASRPGGLSY